MITNEQFDKAYNCVLDLQYYKKVLAAVIETKPERLFSEGCIYIGSADNVVKNNKTAIETELRKIAEKYITMLAGLYAGYQNEIIAAFEKGITQTDAYLSSIITDYKNQ